MTVAIFLKAIATLLFIATGGAVVLPWFRRHPGAMIAAGLVSIIGSYYVGQSLYNDLKNGIVKEVIASRPKPEIKTHKPIEPLSKEAGGQEKVKIVTLPKQPPEEKTPSLKKTAPEVKPKLDCSGPNPPIACLWRKE